MDNNFTHYLALKLVKVGTDAYVVCVCDGIGTDGQLRHLETAANDGQLQTGIYVAFGLHVGVQLFTSNFARELTDDEMESMNLGQQRGDSCAFNTVYALLALNQGLCEMLALGGALTAANDNSSGAKAMSALQHCLLTAMFGPASGMEENNEDFVEVVERSMRKADGSFYHHRDVQDANGLMHDVLWVLWGRFKQADWCDGKVSISNCGEEYHRKVLMGVERSKGVAAPKLSHVAAAHILESWMFVEMALTVMLAVEHQQASGCPDDVMQHIHRVYKHLREWVSGDATTVPAAVSDSLCQITSGGA